MAEANRCRDCQRLLLEENSLCPDCEDIRASLKRPMTIVWRTAVWACFWLFYLTVLYRMSSVWPIVTLYIAATIGPPAIYAFGVAVVSRIVGNPLTWRQILAESASVVRYTLGLVGLITMVLISGFIFLLVTCFGY